MGLMLSLGIWLSDSLSLALSDSDSEGEGTSGLGLGTWDWDWEGSEDTDLGGLVSWLGDTEGLSVGLWGETLALWDMDWLEEMLRLAEADWLWVALMVWDWLPDGDWDTELLIDGLLVVEADPLIVGEMVTLGSCDGVWGLLLVDADAVALGLSVGDAEVDRLACWLMEALVDPDGVADKLSAGLTLPLWLLLFMPLLDGV
jgi:hypothetical protein